LYNDQGSIELYVEFYEECTTNGKPYAWCFYNSESDLIYKHIINPETCSDINLYKELLEVDNEELNNLLIKCEEHKEIFD